MGLFNKLFKKSAKTELKELSRQQEKQKKQQEKKELTLAELKEASGKQPETKKADKKSVKEIVKKADTGDAYKILFRPLVTEKGSYLNSQNKYIFEIAPTANKIQVSKAIKAVYGVKPIKVNIMNLGGKKVRYGRSRGKTKSRKKALITLKNGETIQVYEGV